MHTYMHNYIHTYIHIHIHKHRHTYIHTCINTYIHKNTYRLLCNRVRDLYATFEYQQQLQQIKNEGREPPPPPPNVLAAIEATKANNKPASNTESQSNEPAQDRPRSGDANLSSTTGQNTAEINPGPVVAPKIHQALQVCSCMYICMHMCA